nr:hypothetical protein CFP56_69048 [Quercus suber]
MAEVQRQSAPEDASIRAKLIQLEIASLDERIALANQTRQSISQAMKLRKVRNDARAKVRSALDHQSTRRQALESEGTHGLRELSLVADHQDSVHRGSLGTHGLRELRLVADHQDSVHRGSPSQQVEAVATRQPWFEWCHILRYMGYFSLAWGLLALSFEVLSWSGALTPLSPQSNMVDHLGEHSRDMLSLTSTFDAEIQSQLLAAHQARCHVIEATCQTHPWPRRLPFYVPAEVVWETPDPTRYCVRPVACSPSSLYPYFEDQNYSRREKLGNRLSDLALTLSEGISDIDLLTNALLDASEHLTNRIRIVESCYVHLYRFLAAGHVRVPLASYIPQRLLYALSRSYEQIDRQPMPGVVLPLYIFYREMHGFFAMLCWLFDSRIIVQTSRIDFLNAALDEFWSTQLAYVQRLSDILGPSQALMRSGQTVSSYQACQTNTSAVVGLYSNAAGTNEKILETELNQTCGFFRDTRFRKAARFVHRAREHLTDVTAGGNASSFQQGSAGHIAVAQPWILRLCFGSSWGLVLNVANLPPTQRDDRKFDVLHETTVQAKSTYEHARLMQGIHLPTSYTHVRFRLGLKSVVIIAWVMMDETRVILGDIGQSPGVFGDKATARLHAGKCAGMERGIPCIVKLRIIGRNLLDPFVSDQSFMASTKRSRRWLDHGRPGIVDATGLLQGRGKLLAQDEVKSDETASELESWQPDCLDETFVPSTPSTINRSGWEDEDDDDADDADADLYDLHAEVRSLRHEACMHHFLNTCRELALAPSWMKYLASLGLLLLTLLFALHGMLNWTITHGLLEESIVLQQQPEGPFVPGITTFLDVRASDEAALDRIAFMLPRHWHTWIDPPLDLQRYHVSSLQDQLDEIIGQLQELMQNERPSLLAMTIGQCGDLTEDMQHALGQEIMLDVQHEGDEPQMYYHKDKDMGNLNKLCALDPSPPSGWLAEAAGRGHVEAPDAGQTLRPVSFVRRHWRKWRATKNAKTLLAALANKSKERMSFYAQVRRALVAMAELSQREPLTSAVAFSQIVTSYVEQVNEHDGRTIDEHLRDLGSMDRQILLNGYRERYALHSFLSLLVESVVPAIDGKLRAIDSFRENLEELQLQPDSTLVVQADRTMRAWLAAGDWAQVVSSVQLDGGIIRNATCAWTRNHMPLQRAIPLRADQEPSPRARASNSLFPFLRSSARRTTLASEHLRRAWLHRALLQRTWQAYGAKTTLWTWEGLESPEVTLLNRTYRKEVETDATVAGWPEQDGEDGGGWCNLSLSLAAAVMARQSQASVPARKFQDELRVTWPAMRSRRECKSTHRGCAMSAGGGKRSQLEEDEVK